MKPISLLVVAGPYDPPLHPMTVQRVVDSATKQYRKGVCPLTVARTAIWEDCRTNQVHFSIEQAEQFAIAVANHLDPLRVPAAEALQAQAAA